MAPPDGGGIRPAMEDDDDDEPKEDEDEDEREEDVVTLEDNRGGCSLSETADAAFDG